MTVLGALMGFLLLSHGAPAPSKAATPSLPSYAVTLTAYNAVPEQTDGNPFETASGAYSNPEIVAARSQDLADELPFGTIIELDGPASAQNNCGYSVVAARIGYRVIEDTMNARYTSRVDVLLDAKEDYTAANKEMKNAAEVLGVCKGMTVRVVGHIEGNRLPKTQAALAALVAGGATLALK